MMGKSSRRIPNKTAIALNLNLNTGQAQSNTPSSFGTLGNQYKVQTFGFSIKTFCPTFYIKMLILCISTFTNGELSQVTISPIGTNDKVTDMKIYTKETVAMVETLFNLWTHLPVNIGICNQVSTDSMLPLVPV